jgi:xanthine dehydrogenase accessory factor
MFGSIGGGLMEYNLVELAKKHLLEKNYKAFFKRQTHNKKSKNSSGMICSGTQTIAFNFITKNELATVQKIISQPSYILLSQDGIQIVEATEIETTIDTEDKWSYLEMTEQKIRVHLFGAGHVSLPCSDLFAKLGYEVYLYDNRLNLNTFESNQSVLFKSVIDYQQINPKLIIKPEDYVVLMTHKFVEDKLILSQLLDKPIAYLGVLGSKNKIKLMFEALIEEGHSKQALSKVFAPIGLPIYSQTPEEIAVSIAAEIIKHSKLIN